MPPAIPDLTAEDDLIPLSALQHYLYCPRQCALIHVERLWAENLFTAEGRILHERSEKPGHDTRGDARVITAMPIRSFALGVAGVADVVELRRDGAVWKPYPVEYKRGAPKAHRADEVQLLCPGALPRRDVLHRNCRGRAVLRKNTATQVCDLRCRASPANACRCYRDLGIDR